LRIPSNGENKVSHARKVLGGFGHDGIWHTGQHDIGSHTVCAPSQEYPNP